MRDEFDRCWPWMEEALESVAYRYGNVVWPPYHKEHIWQRIENKRAVFWPGRDCAILTEIVNYPTGLKDHNTWLAGGKLTEIRDMIPGIEEWGRANGCHRQVGSGRRGWVRVFDGYREFASRKDKVLLTPAGERATPEFYRYPLHRESPEGF